MFHLVRKVGQTILGARAQPPVAQRASEALVAERWAFPHSDCDKFTTHAVNSLSELRG